MNALAVIALLATSATVPNAAIRVDQAGYEARSPKIAIVASAGSGDGFTVNRVDDGGVVFEGKLSAAVFDRDSGERVRHADFSALVEPGRYEIRVERLGRSWPFEIGEMPHAPVLRLAARSYYGQRCGTAVDLGDGWSHEACHKPGAFHPSSGKSGETASARGWHDAGDYGRYLPTSGIATGTLLLAWELYPERFAALELDIPESGDGTPDLLDEVRWNLEWMLSMQDDDGGVWHKQTSASFPPFVMPEDDGTTSFVIGTGSRPFKSSCASGSFAAAMAMASRAYAPFDAAFATETRGAAERAWAWLERNPDVTFRNPEGILTGEYGDRDCEDERLWAAAELWRASGNEQAHRHFRANARRAIRSVGDASPPDWADVGPLAAWSYALGESGDPVVVAAIRARSLAAARTIVARASRHPMRIPMTSRDWVWGSNGVAANYGVQLLIANRMQPHSSFVDAAAEILHYILGRNPFSLSWVTGVGSSPAKHPHHRPSGRDSIADPWPGLLIGGPNEQRQDPVLRALPRGVPPARMYADDQESYASNEIAINWNAPLVLLLAGL